MQAAGRAGGRGAVSGYVPQVTQVWLKAGGRRLPTDSTRAGPNAGSPALPARGADTGATPKGVRCVSPRPNRPLHSCCGYVSNMVSKVGKVFGSQGRKADEPRASRRAFGRCVRCHCTGIFWQCCTRAWRCKEMRRLQASRRRGVRDGVPRGCRYARAACAGPLPRARPMSHSSPECLQHSVGPSRGAPAWPKCLGVIRSGRPLKAEDAYWLAAARSAALRRARPPSHREVLFEYIYQCQK